MLFECRACGRTKEHDPARGHVPPGWRMKRDIPKVASVLLLCEGCSHEGNFIGGLSSMLENRLRERGLIKDK